jgi:Tfp pilus assembly protein PilN
LPVAMRQASSPLQWIPVGAAGVAVLLLAGALVAFPAFENRRFERSLQAQIAAVMPRADRAGQIDKEIAADGRRMQLLDDFRRRPKADMDVLAELTRILPPPTWLTSMEISPAQVIVDGETDQAAPLLKVVDTSPLFESSEFQMGPVPKPGGAMFRIKTNRKNLGPGSGTVRK